MRTPSFIEFLTKDFFFGYKYPSSSTFAAITNLFYKAKKKKKKKKKKMTILIDQPDIGKIFYFFWLFISHCLINFDFIITCL